MMAAGLLLSCAIKPFCLTARISVILRENSDDWFNVEYSYIRGGSVFLSCEAAAWL